MEKRQNKSEYVYANKEDALKHIMSLDLVATESMLADYCLDREKYEIYNLAIHLSIVGLILTTTAAALYS